LLACLGLFALLGVVLTGCGRSAPVVSMPPPVVTVSKPVKKAVVDFLDFTGQAESVAKVNVQPQVSGILVRRLYTPGTDVKAGDRKPEFAAALFSQLAACANAGPLRTLTYLEPGYNFLADEIFVIDPQVYYANVAKAGANVSLSQARVDEMQKIYDIKVSAGIGASPLEVVQALGNLESARASLLEARAALLRAQIDLNFTRIRTPISGRAGEDQVKPGNLVTANSTVLTTIVATEPIYLYFDVDDVTVAYIRGLIEQGKFKSARTSTVKVRFALPSEEGFPHEAVIDFVDNRIDPNTGTLRVRAVFPNDRSLVTVGQPAVKVRLPLGEATDRLLVTDRALVTDQDQQVLYVVNDKNEVEYRPVKVGQTHEGLRVIEAGLKEGDRVIVSGLQRVRPGVTVEPRLVEMPRVASEPAVTPAPGTVKKSYPDR
jgi:multidrug efflux system membrane fusion protein